MISRSTHRTLGIWPVGRSRYVGLFDTRVSWVWRGWGSWVVGVAAENWNTGRVRIVRRRDGKRVDLDYRRTDVWICLPCLALGLHFTGVRREVVVED